MNDTQNIANCLKAVTQEWKSMEKVRCVVRDNAANMAKACRLLQDQFGWDHEGCVVMPWPRICYCLHCNVHVTYKLCGAALNQLYQLIMAVTVRLEKNYLFNR